MTFWVRDDPGADPTVTVSSPDVTAAYTGTGPYTITFTVPLTAAQTASLTEGENVWTLWRTDAGGKRRLASGVVQVLTDPAKAS